MKTIAPQQTEPQETMQDLVFKIVERSSCNNFDGSFVVASLRANPHLWRGAIFGRFESVTPFTLHLKPGETYRPSCLYGATLRDIGNGEYNADTLLLTAPTGAEAALEALARTWHADEIDWQDTPHAGKTLRVWWD